MKSVKYALIALIMLNVQLIFSQNAKKDTTIHHQVDLNTVEVTATSNPSKAILNQPTSIIKLNKIELSRSVGIYLDDVINTNVPGVTMERRTVSAGQQFNIRGYGNGIRGTNGVNSNFDGQGSKVYLNGIPITDAEGITLMDDIDFGSIGNVEVTKGPAGTLYGMAISGVINLQTQKAEKGKISIGQDAMFGSYGLGRFTTHLNIGGENSSLMINYGHQTYDGFIVHTASHKDFVNLFGDFHPNEKQSVSAYFGYSNSYDERQGELEVDQYNNFDYSGNPAYIKNNAHTNVISYRGGLENTYNFSKTFSNTTSVFGSGISSNVSSAGGWTDKSPVNYGARTTFGLRFPLSEKVKLNGIIGGEIQQQFAQVIGYGMVANPDTTNPDAYNVIGAARSNQVYRTTNGSLFTEWTLVLPHDFTVTAGIGMSIMNINLNDRFYVANSTKPTNYAKTYNGMVSPHIALNKVFNKTISAYISYSKGYRAPVSSYFFIPTTGQVNTNLNPEIGNQFEIGSKGDLFDGRFHYEVALFNAIFSNKMTTEAVPLNPPAVGTAYTYIVNRGSQNDKGLEILVKYAVVRSNAGFFKLVSPFANFTYSSFKYTDYTYQTLSADKKSVVTVDYSGNAVAGVSPIVANVGLDVMTKPGLYANATYSYKDAMPFTSDGLNKTKAYGLVNAKIGFQKSIWHFDFDVYAGAVNMTGTQYYMMVFINQMPDAYIPAPNKMNFFGGINLKFNL
ncbi:MAG: TonB-dependent receptor [Bacteroidota bacterium]